MRYYLDSIDWQVVRFEDGKRIAISPTHWHIDGLAAWLDQAEADKLIPVGDIHDLQTELISLREGRF